MMGNRTTGTILILITGLTIWLWFRQASLAPSKPAETITPISHQPVEPTLDLLEPLNIALRAPVELDFMSKQQIYTLRKQWINSETKLRPNNYEPADAVFQSIGDGKPWWGLSGIYGLGTGIVSIEGPSDESRFLANPYMLVGLCETHAWTGMNAPDYNVSFYPTPLSLIYKSRSEASVRYNVSDHFSYLVQNNYADGHKRELNLVAYNARDLGYNYLAIDQVRSENVIWNNTQPGAASIRQMIHAGSSCGHPDGCNNMSPLQPELNIAIPLTPARATIKLWREKPADVNATADMTFVLELI